jgi:hypothetical protein
MTPIPPPPFSRKGVRSRTPWGKFTAHPPSPAPGAGVTNHLPRLAGEDGRGCSYLSRASAGGPAEEP